ncbi:DNA cytosine methyltransferase [Kordiimonas sp. SCSIO 12603]|uniref:DNA cytosine methyltransferase n=1 Tax=Kordiimonas sp. SCSIO 12603 TaxID=2829596 RepID=UPI002105C6EE|nr:DNA cytosine methyltransferase [Kordiimonas sp. SCSIO 12603]UTW59297.1 DNA cytosine methyltransferase [Kordiimonas sp. SCSIO 12603]
MTIPVLSFFTGAGLLDLGMHNAGFNVVWRNEYHPAFIKGFQSGFSSHLGIHTDDLPVNGLSITDLTPYSIRQEAFTGRQWPEAFGVIGGPPCPDFSVGGKNKGADGDNGRLTGVYFEQIKGLQPTFFIFENVKGILSTVRHRKYLVSQLDKLKNDYVFDIKILNSLDLGVPQDRERVVVIGFHKAYLSDITDTMEFREIVRKNAFLLQNDLDRNCFTMTSWFDWPFENKFDNAKFKYAWPTTNRFGTEISKPNDVPLELCVGHYLENLSNLQNQDEFFKPISDKFHSVEEGDVSRKSFKRLHRWRYSPTAAYGNNEVHLHPYKARRLSVREAMKIQTIPDTYILPQDMTLSDKYKTIGNGVPVQLAQLVGAKVMETLENEMISVGN